MGCCCRAENYGSNGCAIACAIRTCKSIDLLVNAWVTWIYDGIFVEGTSELESLNLCMHVGTCIGSCGVCSDIIILNTRKHTWFDHSQSTCYYHPNIQLIRIQHRSLHDYNIHHLQHSVIAELQLLRVFAAHPVRSVLVQA